MKLYIREEMRCQKTGANKSKILLKKPSGSGFRSFEGTVGPYPFGQMEKEHVGQMTLGGQVIRLHLTLLHLMSLHVGSVYHTPRSIYIYIYIYS